MATFAAAPSAKGGESHDGHKDREDDAHHQEYHQSIVSGQDLRGTNPGGKEINKGINMWQTYPLIILLPSKSRELKRVHLKSPVQPERKRAIFNTFNTVTQAMNTPVFSCQSAGSKRYILSKEVTKQFQLGVLPPSSRSREAASDKSARGR